MFNQDALIAALLAFCVTLLAALFLPSISELLPDMARSAAVYLAVLLIVAGVAQYLRRRRRD
jgi:predicted permease